MEVVHAGCQTPRHLPGGLLVLFPLSPLDFLGARPLPSSLEVHPFLGVLEDQRAPYLLAFLEAPIETSVVLLRDSNGKKEEGERSEKAWWSKDWAHWYWMKANTNIPRLALPGYS